MGPGFCDMCEIRTRASPAPVGLGIDKGSQCCKFWRHEQDPSVGYSASTQDFFVLRDKTTHGLSSARGLKLLYRHEKLLFGVLNREKE